MKMKAKGNIMKMKAKGNIIKVKAILFLAAVTIFTIIFLLISSCTIISPSGTTSGDGSIKEQQSMEATITTAKVTETTSNKETEITTAI